MLSNLFIKRLINVLLAFLVSLTLGAYASTPKSIKYIEELFLDDDTVYTHYRVTCKDGKEIDISSWDNNKLWCEGKGKKETCNKKKIKTAKQVCS